MLRKIVRPVTPPILWDAARHLRRAVDPRPKPPEQLFNGKDELFREMIKGVAVYAEYGVGASTRWVDADTDARIVAVDTSGDWISSVRASLTRPDHILTHVDLGPLGNWGRPVGYARRDRFADYFNAPWSQGLDPELVLIDGRFRVACFLTTLLRARPGCRIVFDDYTGRSAYAIVEDVLAPTARASRQACFVVPPDLDRDAVTAMRDNFAMVME